MYNVLDIVFWGVLTFSILVVLHEGGHFLAARAFGVKVHEFMVGLPGPRIAIKTKSTTYGITAIPLGGYVRIAGMEPGAEDELLAPALKAVTLAGRMDAHLLARELGVDEERADSLLITLADWGAIAPADNDKYSYTPLMSAEESDDATDLLARARAWTYRGLSTWKRIAVLVMGIFVNLVTAILVFTVVLAMWGYYQQSLTLDDVQAGSGAALAGLQAGDTILALDDEPVNDWMTLTQTIASHDPGESIVVGVERDGGRLDLEATLGENDDGFAYLGVIASVEKVDVSWPAAFVESLTWTGMVFATIFGMFFDADLFQQTLHGSRSVVGVSVEVARAAAAGPIDYAWWIALLSLSLGVMNLLPIPPLDGGKILMELIERIIGKPIEKRVSLGISLAGALLLFSFIGYVMYADVMRYFVNGG